MDEYQEYPELDGWVGEIMEDADARIELLRALRAAGLTGERLAALYPCVRAFCPSAQRSAVLDEREARVNVLSWPAVEVQHVHAIEKGIDAALERSPRVYSRATQPQTGPKLVRTILEVGAGSGFFAWLIETSGDGKSDVMAMDSGTGHTWVAMWSNVSNVVERSDPFGSDLESGDLRYGWPWTSKTSRGAGCSHKGHCCSYNSDTLLLCWPESGNAMADEALELFENYDPGGCLVFVGEEKGGETATDAFYDRIAAGWTLEGEATEVKGSPGTTVSVYSRLDRQAQPEAKRAKE